VDSTCILRGNPDGASESGPQNFELLLPVHESRQPVNQIESVPQNEPVNEVGNGVETLNLENEVAEIPAISNGQPSPEVESGDNRRYPLRERKQTQFFSFNCVSQ